MVSCRFSLFRQPIDPWIAMLGSPPRDYFKARDAIDFATLVDGIGHLGMSRKCQYSIIDNLTIM